ncbi:4-alpha-glucanotransferase [Anaerohalosphaera lusitana]|uniref:4-alpha-glucanotransferase n=1 Tax=Anaerohalosphaera lusitana TaxID=1936003 RepID=A0A1U9NL52_9BACT|nr:4-alpha-glucanotransferase [Anaerohalosphaera lusitana]AQT68458.1 4-alpha-glucanotransferase [Anaerohalosphaera lusitana]
MLKKRASGILMHITSLPGRFGIGDFGPAAYKFVDFLRESGQNYWQILPLNYTSPEMGNSPYSGFSAFAGNPLLISPELLYRQGLLNRSDLTPVPDFSKTAVDYEAILGYKTRLFDAAFERFTPDADFEEFVQSNSYWLEDFALFMTLKQEYGKKKFNAWPAPIRNRRSGAMNKAKKEHAQQLRKECFLQYIFAHQYDQLKTYCNDQGIQIFGDLPIYVTYDSADVWAHPEVFKLRKDRKPEMIAGVPPDYFSETGQLWGNPVYNWDTLRKTRYDWWMRRIKYNLSLFDMLRIDHFRGLEAFWEVKANAKTAINGQWTPGPANHFFDELFRQIPQAALIAEDLGYITAEVRELINDYNFPCMKVIQFAFDSEDGDNLHMPHNHTRNSVVYTGTHDNNTTVGWFNTELQEYQKKLLSDYAGTKINARNVHWQMIRLAMASTSKIAITPMQDVLGLDADQRMNCPARPEGNWKWRLPARKITPALTEKLHRLTRIFGRC